MLVITSMSLSSTFPLVRQKESSSLRSLMARCSLRPKNQSNGGLAFFSNAPEHFILLFPFNAAHPEQGGVDIIGPFGPTKSPVFQVKHQRQQNPFLSGIETFIADLVGKRVRQMFLEIVQIEMFEIGELAKVKQQVYAHHFTVRHFPFPVSPFNVTVF